MFERLIIGDLVEELGKDNNRCWITLVEKMSHYGDNLEIFTIEMMSVTDKIKSGCGPGATNKFNIYTISAARNITKYDCPQADLIHEREDVRYTETLGAVSIMPSIRTITLKAIVAPITLSNAEKLICDVNNIKYGGE